MTRRLPILGLFLCLPFPAAVAQAKLTKPQFTKPMPVVAPTGVTNGTLTAVAPAGPAPASLTITGTPASASLSWSAVGGATGYRVYRAVAPSGAWTPLTPAPVVALTYGDMSGLDYRQGYLYRVVSVFPSGDGAPIDRPFQPPTPVNPAWVKAVQSGTSVTITWAPVPGVSKYELFGQSQAEWQEIVPPATSYTYSNAAVGPHTWKVAGYYLPGPASTPASAWPSASLTVVRNIDVRYMYPNGGSTVEIYFNAVPGATNYALRRGTSAQGPFLPLDPADTRAILQNLAVTPNCCEIYDEGAYKLGGGRSLWYVIDALNGTSPMFTSLPLQIDLPVWFRGPLSIDIQKTGSDQWTIAWEAVQEATSYRVILRMGSGVITTYLKDFSPGTNQVNINGLVSGSLYSLYVTAVIPYNGTVSGRAGQKDYKAP